jgi:hypothetical protein
MKAWPNRNCAADCLSHGTVLTVWKSQDLLDYLVDVGFSAGSGLGVMPAFPILAHKYPKEAANVVRKAPMPLIRKFNISNLLESDLDPMAALTTSEAEPLDVKVRCACLAATFCFSLGHILVCR